MQNYINDIILNGLGRIYTIINEGNPLNICIELDNKVLDDKYLNSPMDQFEIKPFLGEFLGLNYTPIGLVTNILVYIGLVITFI